MNVLFAITSVAFFYLSGLNSVLARVSSTCNNGDAGQLIGIIFTAFFAAIAFGAMLLSGYRRNILIATAPVLFVFLWQAVFSFQMAFSLLVQSAPACEFLNSTDQTADGSETFYAVSWVVVSVSIWIGFYLLGFNRKDRNHDTSPRHK